MHPPVSVVRRAVTGLSLETPSLCIRLRFDAWRKAGSMRLMYWPGADRNCWRGRSPKGTLSIMASYLMPVACVLRPGIPPSMVSGSSTSICSATGVISHSSPLFIPTCWARTKVLHRPGIEPGASRCWSDCSDELSWQRLILPLNHQCLMQRRV